MFGAHQTDYFRNCTSAESGSTRVVAPLAAIGLDAATGQGKSQFSLRQAKYFPVPPGGFSIGPGTSSRTIGKRNTFRPRLRCSSEGGDFLNPITSGPLMT